MPAPTLSPIEVWRTLVGRPPGPPHTLSPEEESTLARAVHKLSQGFSGSRNLAGHGYLDDPALLGAYLIFYATVSSAQVRRLAERIDLRPPHPEARALDLGCGPGPVVRVLRELGWHHVQAGDHAEGALRVLRHLHGPEVGTFVWDGEAASTLPVGPYHLITLGHVVNELFKREPDRVARRCELVRTLVDQLAPGGRLVILEPARHAVNEDHLALRDAVVAAGLHLEGPCFTTLPCPARAAGAACHDATTWEPPRAVARLAQLAHLDKATLAFAWLSVRPGPTAEEGFPAVRIVSERMRNKAGRERFLVCGAEGRFSLSAPAERRGQPWEPVWRALDRGDAVRVEAPEQREAGWGLLPATRLHPSAPR